MADRWRKRVAYLASLLMLAGLALATSWTVRVSVADLAARQGDVSGLERAIAWMPDQGAWRTKLATLVGVDDPPRATKLLESAVALNPWDTDARIGLGLRLEASEELNRAEQVLLQAARHDNLYLPRWTLANFYYRRGDVARFWEWAGAAAEMVYDDGTALFRLCSAVQEDGRLIDRIHIQRSEVRAHYLGYLLRTQRFDVLMPAVRTLLIEGRPADVALLLHASDRLLDRERTAGALEIWNSLARSHLIPFEPLDPGLGRLLTNGRFAVRPTSHAFDWKPQDVAGVTASREDAQGGLRMAFSGSQPEHCELMAQLVPLPEDADLEFTISYRTADLPRLSGVGWSVIDVTSGARLASTENLYSEDGESRTIRFHTRSSARLVRLSLRYDRVSGTTRAEGYLTIRAVDLRLAPRRISNRGLRFLSRAADL